MGILLHQANHRLNPSRTDFHIRIQQYIIFRLHFLQGFIISAGIPVVSFQLNDSHCGVTGAQECQGIVGGCIVRNNEFHI